MTTALDSSNGAKALLGIGAARKVIAMNRADFEAEIHQEGYEVREGEIEPNQHRPPHAHSFDARLFVLSGSLTLVFGENRCAYGPGDSCAVAAGTVHEEHTGADGVRYLAARRQPTGASASA